MYSTTFERKREIATMRALGARRATILRIVLLEASAITVVGAAVGVLGGHAVAYVVPTSLRPGWESSRIPSPSACCSPSCSEASSSWVRW
jgi:ABC-type antimicrobial peptide transport system permease subunit